MSNATSRTCNVKDCDRAHYAHGICHLHYKRMWDAGKTWPHPTVEERLWSHVVAQPSGCMEWTGSTNSKGYGTIGVDGKTVLTHRLAWTLANGPIPDGFCIRHVVCDNPPCANLDHLALGTQVQNMADRKAKGRGANGRDKRTHCAQGHLYDEANTYTTARGRACVACNRRWCAENRARKRDASRLTNQSLQPSATT
jgi:hypothetical protein